MAISSVKENTLLHKKLNPNYEYISDAKGADRVLEWLEGRKYFVYDSETGSLNPWDKNLVLYQIGNHEKQWLVDNRAVPIQHFREPLEDPNIVKLGHNIKFDFKAAFVYDEIEMRPLADTMINEQIIRCGLGVPVGLGAVSEHYIGVSLDKGKELRSSFVHTPVGGFTEQQLIYAARDVMAPYYVARRQKPLIKERGLTNTINLEYKAIPVIGLMDMRGMKVDEVAWLKLYQEAVQTLHEAEERLDKFFHVNNYSQGDFFTDSQIVREIEYSSWQQVVKALKKRGYNIETTHRDFIALEAIEERLPLDFVQALLLYRTAFTKVTRYGKGFLEATNPLTRRVHSDFTQAFTTSGRLSSGRNKEGGKMKNINLQNIPHDPRYRACFVPEKGNVFVVYDLKAIEPRVMGDLSHDPVYIETFSTHGDIYNQIGTTLYGETVSKAPGRPAELRAKTKIGVLGTAYGTGKNKFHRKMLLDLNLTPEGLLRDTITLIEREESDELWEGIFRTCAVLKESLDEWSKVADPITSERRVYDAIAAAEPFKKVFGRIMGVLKDRYPDLEEEVLIEKANTLTRNRGYVTFSQTVGGRKRFFKIYHTTWWTEGRNHPIQGTAGGDVMKTAMVSIDEEIRRRGHSKVVWIINQVHDEIVVECKRELAEEVAEYVKQRFIEAGQKYLRTVACEVDGGICEKWEK